MKPKLLLLSNSMFFHYTFCSFFKSDFTVEPLMLRYITFNPQNKSQHFYTQLKEQKRKKLYKNGIIRDPRRLVLTKKTITYIYEECLKSKPEEIAIEVYDGSKDELLLLKQLNKLGIPITVYISIPHQDLQSKITSHQNIKIKSAAVIQM
ncbi:hypothetical protein [Bacillus toyonensis]|uniref:hypothetical protein n=1 Tax=Bacillus toyonensis TaxID=155322 RepID=UPI002E1C7117|nr:hypothetical protein [Bacillus toyonensis]